MNSFSSRHIGLSENEVNEIIKAKTEHDLDHMFPFKCMFNRFEKYDKFFNNNIYKTA